MEQILIRKSKRKDKKLEAVFENGKRVSFGAKGYEDYTIHKDEKRKENYLARHKNDPKDIHTAGGLSRDILWSKPNMKDAIKFAEKKHHISKTKMESNRVQFPMCNPQDFPECEDINRSSEYEQKSGKNWNKKFRSHKTIQPQDKVQFILYVEDTRNGRVQQQTHQVIADEVQRIVYSHNRWMTVMHSPLEEILY